MRTYTNRSTKMFDGVRYYWRGWSLSYESLAHSEAMRRINGESTFIEFSDEPHIYGGEVNKQPGYHLWGRREKL